SGRGVVFQHRDPVERVGPQSLQGKCTLHQPYRHGAHYHRIGWDEGLEPRCDVWGFPEREVLVSPTPAHHSRHDQTGVDAEPPGELDTIRCRPPGIQGRAGRRAAMMGTSSDVCADPGPEPGIPAGGRRGVVYHLLPLLWYADPCWPGHTGETHAQSLP